MNFDNPLQISKMYKKFGINNFVLFKLKDEWVECRVKEILPSDKPENRNLMLFIIKYNYIHSEPVPDSNVHLSSIENNKKFRFSYKDTEVLIPVFLINFLREDKMKIKNNLVVSLPSKCTVKKIITEFGAFLIENKNSLSEDEKDEIVKGFIHMFNCCIDKFLLYETEFDQIEKLKKKNENVQFAEIYGIEHLVRLIFFMNYKNKNMDDILNENLIYLCDFLDLFYRKYFIERVYSTN